MHANHRCPISCSHIMHGEYSWNIFFFVQNQGQCQEVEYMKVTKEYFETNSLMIDGTDLSNKSQSHLKIIKMDFCYYEGKFNCVSINTLNHIC